MRCARRARNFRQTIVFAAYPFAELHALLRRTTANVSGAVRVYKAYDGSIGLVTSSVRQLFHRVPVSSTAEEPERRMEFFKKVYQQFRSNMATRVLVYVPSYFDFLRVRKFMTEVGTDVLYANEYTERGDLSFALAHFKNGNVEFLVYTERLHFHRRLLVRGAHHIIFYGPPHCAEFYPELVNCIDASAMGASCVLLFTKFDALELERIVGSQRQDRMATSDKPTFMFCT